MESNELSDVSKFPTQAVSRKLTIYFHGIIPFFFFFKLQKKK